MVFGKAMVYLYFSFFVLLFLSVNYNFYLFNENCTR